MIVKYLKLLAIAIFTMSLAHAQTTTLIASGSLWKYLSNGSDQGTAWQAFSFADSSWNLGNAELGYGDGGESTVLSFGPSSSAKYITYYFRKSFNLLNPSEFSFMQLNIMRDDGAVVYLNGVEVVRSNMPAGAITYTSLASSAVGAAFESTYYNYAVPCSLLQAGTNVLAVEVHQNSTTSPDLSFNCNLVASVSSVQPTLAISRGPYLQSLSSSSVVIRWRTNLPADSRVNYGSTWPLSSSVSESIFKTDHAIQISGLLPGTKYYYSIESGNQLLQGNGKNYFKTAPVVGANVPVRIWATGDFGIGTASQAAVRDAFVAYTSNKPADFWIWMGDNAYAAGYDSEYQNKVFNVYPNQFKNIPVFPCLGNHDYANSGYQSASSLALKFPYFSIFTLPYQGESGGLASGTPKYYSYNYANIHLISLDSYGALNNVGSPMYTWLQSDLAANTQMWTIVYFHHPPYSMGTHNSDTEIEMMNMRQNIIPLLESYHVDLVLCGHSHANERSYLMKGHYGLASTFSNAMKLNPTTNNFVKSYPYNGTVYAVCGTAGQNPGGTMLGWPMPCMPFSNNSAFASLVIDVNGSKLMCKYLASDSSIVDQFSIVKKYTPMRLAQGELGLVQMEEQIMVSMEQEETLTGDLSIYGLDGKLVKQYAAINLSKANPHYILKVDLGIANGLYILVFASGNKLFTHKFLLTQ